MTKIKYILLNTATPVCYLSLIDEDNEVFDFEWQANRELSNGLLKFIYGKLGEFKTEITEIKGIGVFRGPGSFTGLRIGLTVANTLADGLGISIVGVSGDDWKNEAAQRLAESDNDKVVMPIYGADAHITKPRK